jgi:hypothetical protein
MPYDSDAQRRYMHARHPGIAERWDSEIREKRKVQPSFGNGGKGHGRRQKDKEEVGKSYLPGMGYVPANKVPNHVLRRAAKVRANYTPPEHYQSDRWDMNDRRLQAKRSRFESRFQQGLYPNPVRRRGKNIAGRRTTDELYRPKPGMKSSEMRQRNRHGADKPPLGRDFHLTGNKNVGKSRFYDPEHRRQRRLGMAEAALAGAGAAGLAVGGHGAVKSTKAVRALSTKVPKGGGDGLRAGTFVTHGKTKAGKGILALRRRDAAALAGGTAGVGGALGLRSYAESRRGTAWR